MSSKLEIARQNLARAQKDLALAEEEDAREKELKRSHPAKIYSLCMQGVSRKLSPEEALELCSMTLPIMRRIKDRLNNLCRGQCDGRPCRCDQEINQLVGLTE